MDGNATAGTQELEETTLDRLLRHPEDHTAAGVIEALGFTYHGRLGCGGEHNVCEVSKDDFLQGKHVALYTPRERQYATLSEDGKRAAEKLEACFQHQQKLHKKGGYVPEPYQQGRVVYDGAEISYLVTECIGSGTTLCDGIQLAGKLSPSVAVGVALKIGETAAMLEHEGELHGDIKPENILLDDRTVYLIDFTLARPLQLNPQPFCGTPEYLCFSYVDTQNPLYLDRHALAVTLYEAIKGSKLFNIYSYKVKGYGGGVCVEDIQAELNKGIPPLKDVILIAPEDIELTDALDDFFQIALNKYENRRHESMHSLVLHLGEIWMQYVLPRNEEVLQQQEHWVRTATEKKKASQLKQTM